MAPVSNEFNAAWQERHDEEIRLSKERRKEATRLREEKKILKREGGTRLNTEEGLESQRR
jgi:hypothetical protein